MPASTVESAVLGAIGRIFERRSWEDIRGHLETITFQNSTLSLCWNAPALDIDALRARLRSDEDLRAEGSAALLSIPFRLRRWRGGGRLFDSSGSPARASAPDRALVDLIQKARRWRAALIEECVPLLDLVAREGVTRVYVVRALRAAYLAPDVVRAVLSGAPPPGLSVDAIAKGDFPLDWNAQRQRFGAERAR